MDTRERRNPVDTDDMVPESSDGAIGAPAAGSEGGSTGTALGGDDLADIGAAEGMESSTGGVAGPGR